MLKISGIKSKKKQTARFTFFFTNKVREFFRELVKKLTSAFILRYFDSNLKIRIKTDVSNYAILKFFFNYSIKSKNL